MTMSSGTKGITWLLAIFGCVVTLMACGEESGGAAPTTLRSLAEARGRSFGSAAHDEHLLDDPTYGVVLAREFDSITPYTAMKWGRLHPEPNRYDFSGADTIVDFARAHAMRVRGHTLVWGGASDPPNPDYVNNVTDPETLRSLVTDHIQTVMRHYAGRVDRWDVVNEPITSLGETGTTDGLRDSVFLQQLGPNYIADALRIAHQADPNAQLFVNDVFVLKPGPKQERYFRLVRDLLDANVPLHGVGFQGHLDFLPVAPPGQVDLPTEAEMTATLQRFAALGVDVEITELNVHTWRLKGDRAARLEQQRELYAGAMRACLAVPRCKAITVWLFTDKYPTSLELLLNRDAYPLLFDESYAPKPAYFGVRDALLGTRP